MTLEDLIKKLEGKSNGVHALFQSWLDEYKELCERIRKKDILPEILNRKLAERRYVYNNLAGFIWGLFAAGYITKEDRDKLSEELRLIQERS